MTLCFLCFSFVGTVMLRHHSWYSLEDGCREQCSRKSHSPNYIMNTKGVPTKGMWIKVFVKALPIRTAYRPNFELRIRSFKLLSASSAIMNYSILSWLNTSYQFKTEQFIMRLGAQFLIQNSRILTLRWFHRRQYLHF